MFLKCVISPDIMEVYINLHFKFSEVQCINEYIIIYIIYNEYNIIMNINEILENVWLVMLIIILLCFLSLEKCLR